MTSPHVSWGKVTLILDNETFRRGFPMAHRRHLRARGTRP